jgi:hypothetical protein
MVHHYLRGNLCILQDRSSRDLEATMITDQDLADAERQELEEPEDWQPIRCEDCGCVEAKCKCGEERDR